MTTEDKLKQCIIDNFGTISDFCNSIDMPKSTISTIFKRGIMSCSITTMCKICKKLCIDMDSLLNGEIVYTTAKKESNTFEFHSFIKELEVSDGIFVYNNKELSKIERLKIAFALKLALEQL